MNPGGVTFAWADVHREIKLTGAGTYAVTKLVSWEFANFQTGTFVDHRGDIKARANGNLVLRASRRGAPSSAT